MSARGAVDSRKEGGAIATAFGHDDGAHLEVRQSSRLLRQLGESGVAGGGAVADPHGVGLVDDDEADIGEGVAGLFDEAGAGEPEQQDGEGEGAPDRAAGAPQQSGGEGDDANRSEKAEQPERDRRVEAEGRIGLREPHWPKRSRMAGTWTWSPL